MHPTLNIAIKAARKAGDIMLRSMDRLDQVHATAKGLHDFVSDVDKRVENEIISIIKKAFPDHQILSEESGMLVGNAECLWIVDPLDGTHNYIRGVPHFSVSIAFSFRGTLEHGVIYDPVRQELFTASRGQGARLNDRRRLRISTTRKLDNALIETGFPVRTPEKLSDYLPLFNELMPMIANIRCSGSAALDLAYVAAGRFDAFMETGIQAWDMAAGALMIKEAGGYVTDWNGTDNYLKEGSVLAGNPEIHEGLLALVARHSRTL